MTTTVSTAERNIALIRTFYEYYAEYDLDGIRQVLSPDVRWHIPGRHPLAGTHRGVEELMAFFRRLGESNFKAEVLYLGADDDHVVDYHRGWSNRGDGADIDITWVLVYRIEDGRIVEARDFAADQAAADDFFNRHYRFAPITSRLAS